MISQLDIAKIRNVLIVAEQGQQRMAYGAVYIYNDGPNNVKQLTLSIGFTQYGGNLGKVLKAYGDAGGKLSEELAPFATKMSDPETVRNARLINLLKEAGSDPVMQRVQEEMFDRLYLDKAIIWGENEGFTLPLSFLIIADSFLHSGSILQSIRNKFPEKTPAHGGNEKIWITQYTNARHDWLANHSNQLLHNTIYRTKYYKVLIANDDWQLDTYYTVAMNGVKPLAVA